jgi:multiple sugar transport system permease protein
VAFFIFLPILGTFWNSLFQDVTFLESRRFVWFSNYLQVLGTVKFWRAALFTTGFTGVSVVLESLLGLIFALILNEKLPARSFLRCAVLIPWAVPLVVSARVWEFIYNYNYGLANYLFLKAGLSDTPVNWLGTPLTAFGSLVLADVWKTTPFMTILFLAGIQSIPTAVYEQARVDGAGAVQRFVKITVPLLKPVLVVALIFRTIDALRIFDLIYVLTGGGPGGTTDSLSMVGYRYFSMGDFGRGSAISMIVFVIVLFFALAYLRFGRFKEGLEE